MINWQSEVEWELEAISASVYGHHRDPTGTTSLYVRGRTTF